MPQYVDGFVLVVPKKKIDDYKKLAAKAGKVWMEYGALSFNECVADDMKTAMGISFPKLTKVKPSEVVVFSWIVYKSKKQRDSINKKVMADPRFANMDPNNMPFDCDKMTYGGFTKMVSLDSK